MWLKTLVVHSKLFLKSGANIQIGWYKKKKNTNRLRKTSKFQDCELKAIYLGKRKCITNKWVVRGVNICD